MDKIDSIDREDENVGEDSGEEDVYKGWELHGLLLLARYLVATQTQYNSEQLRSEQSIHRYPILPIADPQLLKTQHHNYNTYSDSYSHVVFVFHAPST